MEGERDEEIQTCLRNIGESSSLVKCIAATILLLVAPKSQTRITSLVDHRQWDPMQTEKGANGREDLVLFRDLNPTHQQITSSPKHKADDISITITRQFQAMKRRQKKHDSTNSACFASILDKPVAKP